MNETVSIARPEGDLVVNRQHIPFTLDGGVASRAAIGLIVLATDQTIEAEYRTIFTLPGVGLYAARLYNAAAITVESLQAMEADIARTTGLILPNRSLDVVAFACTSGAMVIGEEEVFARIREARPDIACTTPITAAFAAFRALGARRLAVLTPYSDDINQRLRAYIRARGVEVPVLGSFNEEDDTRAACITPASVREAVLELGRHDAVDAVFVSCTSLRVVELVPELEAALGKPVTSSNHAMAWHCLRLAGIEDALPRFGRLFTCAQS
jgi:maleate isomerase